MRLIEKMVLPSKRVRHSVSQTMTREKTHTRNTVYTLCRSYNRFMPHKKNMVSEKKLDKDMCRRRKKEVRDRPVIGRKLWLTFKELLMSRRAAASAGGGGGDVTRRVRPVVTQNKHVHDDVTAALIAIHVDYL